MHSIAVKVWGRYEGISWGERVRWYEILDSSINVMVLHCKPSVTVSVPAVGAAAIMCHLNTPYGETYLRVYTQQDIQTLMSQLSYSYSYKWRHINANKFIFNVNMFMCDSLKCCHLFSYAFEMSMSHPLLLSPVSFIPMHCNSRHIYCIWKINVCLFALLCIFERTYILTYVYTYVHTSYIICRYL